MVQKNVDIPASGGLKKIRTPDSIVWKGVAAGDLVSGVRFSWDRYQKVIFADFLKTVGLSFKNADIKPLLQQLNLDGYEGIENKYGQNVHSLIEEKVWRKLNNTAKELGEDVLKEASLRKSIVYQRPKEIRVESIPTSHVPSQPGTPGTRTKAPAGDSNTSSDRSSRKAGLAEDKVEDKTSAAKPKPTFLRVPQQKDTEISVKQEPDITPPATPPRSNFRSSTLSSRQSSASRARSEQSVPTFESRPPPVFEFAPPPVFEFRSSPAPEPKATPTFKFTSTKPSEASPAASKPLNEAGIADVAKRRRARRSIDHLVSCLLKADEALEDVESIIGDLPSTPEGEELAKVICHLRFAFHDVQNDAEEVEEFSKKNLRV